MFESPSKHPTECTKLRFVLRSELKSKELSSESEILCSLSMLLFFSSDLLMRTRLYKGIFSTLLMSLNRQFQPHACASLSYRILYENTAQESKTFIILQSGICSWGSNGPFRDWQGRWFSRTFQMPKWYRKGILGNEWPMQVVRSRKKFSNLGASMVKKGSLLFTKEQFSLHPEEGFQTWK